MTTAIKSISVSLEFVDLAQRYKISWSEAARVGLSILLAEKGVQDYDNNLNLFRRMKEWQIKAESLMKKSVMH